MLICDNIVLYRTYLRPDYSNVYDFIDDNDFVNYRERYKHFLDLNYVKRTINLTNYLKSRRDTEQTFSFILSGYSSIDLHDFNYVAFKTRYTDSNGTTSNVLKFAFIVSITSANDGDNSKSVIIECKLDAWINNYQYFKNGNNRFIPELSTLNDLTYIPKNIADTITEKEIVGSVYDRNNSGYIVVWQIILTSKELVCSNGGTVSGVKPLINDGSPVLFLPVGILNTKTRKLVPLSSIQVEGLRYIEGYAPEQGILYVDDRVTHTDRSSLLRLCKPNGTFTIENYLSYATPFKYTLSFTIGQDGRYAVLVSLSGEYSYMYGDFYTDSSLPATSIVDPRGAFTPAKIINNDITTNYDTISITNESEYSPERLSENPFRIVKSQACYSYYPFNYYSIIIAGNTVDIVPFPYSSGDFKIETHRIGLYTVIRILTDTGYQGKDSSISFLLNNQTKSLKIVTDELNDYLIRNGNQLDNERNIASMNTGLAVANSITSLIPSLLSGKGILNGVMNVGMSAVNGAFKEAQLNMTQNAKKADISQYPNSVEANGESSLTGIEYLDDIVIVRNTSRAVKELETKRPDIYTLLYEIHLHGYYSANNIDIFSIRRDIFDFVSGDFNLKASINSNDLYEIQNALKSGIRFWHIDENDTVENLSGHNRNYFIKNFNHSVSNPIYTRG